MDEEGTHLGRANTLSVMVRPSVTLDRIDDGLSPQRSMARSLTESFSSGAGVFGSLADGRYTLRYGTEALL